MRVPFCSYELSQSSLRGWSTGIFVHRCLRIRQFVVFTSNGTVNWERSPLMVVAVIVTL